MHWCQKLWIWWHCWPLEELEQYLCQLWNERWFGNWSWSQNAFWKPNHIQSCSASKCCCSRLSLARWKSLRDDQQTWSLCHWHQWTNGWSRYRKDSQDSRILWWTTNTYCDHICQSIHWRQPFTGRWRSIPSQSWRSSTKWRRLAYTLFPSRSSWLRIILQIAFKQIILHPWRCYSLCHLEQSRRLGWWSWHSHLWSWNSFRRKLSSSKWWESSSAWKAILDP